MQDYGGKNLGQDAFRLQIRDMVENILSSMNLKKKIGSLERLPHTLILIHPEERRRLGAVTLKGMRMVTKQTRKTNNYSIDDSRKKVFNPLSMMKFFATTLSPIRQTAALQKPRKVEI